MKRVKRTRAACAIWLVGGTDENFNPSKLPSRGEVLKVLFHYHDRQEMSLKESISKTVELLLVIWDKARIPTKAPNHVAEHIGKLHGEWKGLKKLINRVSATNLANQQKFQETLDDIFDVAHHDAMSLIKIKEDRLFLHAQREKGRRGTIGGVDRKLAEQEERTKRKKTAEESRIMKAQAAAASATAVAVLDDSSSDSTVIYDPLPKAPLPEADSRRKPQLRGKVAVVTREVSAALDRTNTSDRKASHILAAVASTSQLGPKPPDVADLILSHSSIRRARRKFRSDFAAEVKASFNPAVPLVLHWDGKVMEDYTGSLHGRVDRLPILVSGQNVIKLLAVPKLHDQTAGTMTQSIVETIDEWRLRDRIKGLCFDTTASNTGEIGGVCIKLETEIGRALLNLACRHHMHELMLEHVFSLHDLSKSPNIEIFGNFREIWPRVDQSSYSTAMQDRRTAATVTPWKDDIIQFALTQLEKFQPRDDYRELLELVVIFLGGTPARGISFRYPGAIHRARWMARAIYSIKMWLFRDQYKLQQRAGSRGTSHSDKVWDHITKVCIFVTAVYVKYWYQCQSAAQAPRNDLSLLHLLLEYPDRTIAEAATQAFGRHLWYLSEILVAFALFDDEVSIAEKRLMVAALKEKDGSEDPPKRIKLKDIHDLSSKQLHNFVTKTTGRFFTILDLCNDFLDLDPSKWINDESYKMCQDIIKTVKVVNDLAERGVALIQEFNSSITRNEEQKQFLLQIVEDHRRQFSAPTKAAAVKRARQM
jgi:hypothetical protein